MKRLFVTLALLALAPAVAAQDSYQNRLFTINAPASSGDYANSQPVLMSLPYDQGFAPNVNVQVQVYQGSMEAYVQLSEEQFRALNWKLIKKGVTENKALFEYAGEYNGRAMHWYTEAIRRGDRVYLITATTLEAQWSSYGSRLIASVQSFRLRQ